MNLITLLGYYKKLEHKDILKEGNYIEWTENTFTKIDKGSLFIGKQVEDLPLIMKNNLSRRTALAFSNKD